MTARRDMVLKLVDVHSEWRAAGMRIHAGALSVVRVV